MTKMERAIIRVCYTIRSTVNSSLVKEYGIVLSALQIDDSYRPLKVGSR